VASLGKTSLQRLDECHPDLQRLVRAVVARMPAGDDLTVLCGYRGQKEQDDAFARGTSKLKFPKSKHNNKPARAVDIAPYPVDWHDRAAFDRQRAFVLAVASDLGIRIRVIDWDLPHFELL
jgi:peptidoglycan L-alanyl-D-glutamate endopeptidase CwlK